MKSEETMKNVRHRVSFRLIIILSVLLLIPLLPFSAADADEDPPESRAREARTGDPTDCSRLTLLYPLLTG